MKKGMELPVSTLVMIVIAVIILVFVLFILGTTNPIRNQFVIEGALRTGCSALLSANCDRSALNSIQVKIGESSESLADFCTNKLGLTAECCMKRCGCPSTCP